MRNETEDSVDLWRQVASAVEYIAAVDRPGFTVWDALSEAAICWSADSLDAEDLDARFIDTTDRVRGALEVVLRHFPPADAPGGAFISEVIESALGVWLEAVALDFNGGRPFAG